VSDLFGSVCKYCHDPEATHIRAVDGPREVRRTCFIMGCDCPGYERDNLAYLEEKSDEQSSL